MTMQLFYLEHFNFQLNLITFADDTIILAFYKGPILAESFVQRYYNKINHCAKKK